MTFVRIVFKALFMLLLLLAAFESHGAPRVFWVNLISNFDSEVRGTIEISSFNRGAIGAPATYSILYSYYVGDDLFISRVVSGHDFSQRVKETLSKYEKGQVVVVHYDSRRPGYSVIEKTGISFLVGLKMFFVLLTPLTYLFWNIYLRMK
ncbi:DUF3592 domain-containing protein [Marinimicrobium sp. ABcell2]|uniref:DUF3592 domain-containing protein n=1 Tax=Marinimicrobium sp. ABcell2 TaxID=3069751 RepID=UPI0027B46720|nr:DUF3592 domain-containing protein [Marinimicrobium sp. ABcell2]MDQ2077663.1 hypothetical protein [Marinimicrobium sp. ABcell2]